MFLLSKFDKKNNINNEKIKNIECLFNEKNSSTENERISPVTPNDSISKKFILSTVVHQL